MVEIRSAPAHRGVAVRTIVQRECRAGRGVRRICGRLPRGDVAAHGAAGVGRNLQIVVVVDMAGRARHTSVAIGQQEARGTVIEFCVQPGIERVAAFASGREFGAGVIWIGGLLVILQMASDALRGESLILPNRRALMAILALHRGMRP